MDYELDDCSITIDFDYQFVNFTFDFERQADPISSLFIQLYFIGDLGDYFIVFITNEANRSLTVLNYLTCEVVNVLIRICSFFSTHALCLRFTPGNYFLAGLRCSKGECCTLLVSTSKISLQTSFLGFEPAPPQMITTRFWCASLRKCCASCFIVGSIVRRSPLTGNLSARSRYTRWRLQKTSFLTLSTCPKFLLAWLSTPDFLWICFACECAKSKCRFFSQAFWDFILSSTFPVSKC